MSLIKEEYYIVKQAKSLTGEGLQPKLAGYKNTVYDNYPSALQRASEVCRASGNEMLVFKAVSRVTAEQTTTAKVEKL